MIEKIFEKISNYNFFNNLLPGILFIEFNKYHFNINYTVSNIFVLIAISYFCGVTISRIGSLLISNIAFKFTKEKGEEYKKYIDATTKDEKISLLLQDRNMYRTLSALILVCIIEIIIFNVLKIINIPKQIIILLILIILYVIYTASFCKQNNFICERIRNSSKKI